MSSPTPTPAPALRDGDRGLLPGADLRREVAIRRTLKHVAELLITAAVLFVFVFVLPAVFGGL